MPFPVVSWLALSTTFPVIEQSLTDTLARSVDDGEDLHGDSLPDGAVGRGAITNAGSNAAIVRTDAVVVTSSYACTRSYVTYPIVAIITDSEAEKSPPKTV